MDPPTSLPKPQPLTAAPRVIMPRAPSMDSPATMYSSMFNSPALFSPAIWQMGASNGGNTPVIVPPADPFAADDVSAFTVPVSSASDPTTTGNSSATPGVSTALPDNFMSKLAKPKPHAQPPMSMSMPTIPSSVSANVLGMNAMGMNMNPLTIGMSMAMGLPMGINSIGMAMNPMTMGGINMGMGMNVNPVHSTSQASHSMTHVSDPTLVIPMAVSQAEDSQQRMGDLTYNEHPQWVLQIMSRSPSSNSSTPSTTPLTNASSASSTAAVAAGTPMSNGTSLNTTSATSRSMTGGEPVFQVSLQTRTGRIPYHSWVAKHEHAGHPNEVNDAEWYKTSVYSIRMSFCVSGASLSTEKDDLPYEVTVQLLREKDGEVQPDGLSFQKPHPFSIAAKRAADNVVTYEGELGPFSPAKFSFVHHGSAVRFRLRLIATCPGGPGFVVVSPGFIIKSKKPKLEAGASGTKRGLSDEAEAKLGVSSNAKRPRYGPNPSGRTANVEVEDVSAT